MTSRTRTLLAVHYYFDESGDFAFPEGRYDVYVQAALICPDSFVDKVAPRPSRRDAGARAGEA
jgi:hypothetical protein